MCHKYRSQRTLEPVLRNQRSRHSENLHTTTDEVPLTSSMVNALITAANVNVKPFWPGLFAKALANVNIETLIYNTGLVALPQQEVLPLQRTKREQRKKTLRSLKMT
ncbi:hypothetical protein MJG53_010999 [Ovis ammon polii x Ovis aries]|uniref:Uncharacterized protein n=1 Tax=Ovis ammon polii x Ovis aries TaxID=2918886 RepID=A0ACB9URE8_9CETA|nr:hypothetical protein MJG53_010999 [Ovis ammon polii x Ovis aries]